MRRRGVSAVVLLVVLLLVGLLAHQVARSLWILRVWQRQQVHIGQAQALLAIGLQLDQQYGISQVNSRMNAPMLITLGDHYGKVELDLGVDKTGVESHWIAKYPVDAEGRETAEQACVSVSCKRIRNR